MVTNNWLPDIQEFEQHILPILEKEGKSIGLASQNGNKIAKNIIKYYSMLYRSFDPMTHCLLKQELEKWNLPVDYTI